MSYLPTPAAADQVIAPSIATTDTLRGLHGRAEVQYTPQAIADLIRDLNAVKPLQIAQTYGAQPDADQGAFLNKFVVHENIQFAGKIDVLTLEHHYGGGAGGRNTSEVFSFFDSASLPSNTDRNYVGFASSFFASAADSPDTNGNGGGGFAVNFVATVGPGVKWYNITGGEINFGIETGGSAILKSGLSIAPNPTDTVQATLYDCGLSISSQNATLGLRHGILFSNYNGYFPCRADGTLIGVAGPGAATRNGIDFTGCKFSGAAFASANFQVDGSGEMLANSLSIFGNLGPPGQALLVPASHANRGGLVGWNASNLSGEVSYINTYPGAQNAHEWYQQIADGSLRALGAVDSTGAWQFPVSVFTPRLEFTPGGAVQAFYDPAPGKILFQIGGVVVMSVDAGGNIRSKGTLTGSVVP